MHSRRGARKGTVVEIVPREPAHGARLAEEIEPRYDAAVDRDLRHAHFHHPLSPSLPVRYRPSLEHAHVYLSWHGRSNETYVYRNLMQPLSLCPDFAHSVSLETGASIEIQR